MFGDRFDSLLKELDISTKALSEFMACDKSYINKVRAGGRNVRRNSKAANTMINGVFEYALNNGAYDRLCFAIGLPDELPQKEVMDKVEQWLFEGSGETRAGQLTSEVFSDKFKAVLKIANLSNVRLAKFLNIDASLVSRWRTGFSAPATAELQDALCRVLLNRIYAQDRKNELAELVSAASASFAGEETAFEALKDWLFSVRDTNSTIVESFLSEIDKITDIPIEGNISPLPFEKAVDTAVLDDISSDYTGNDGLRKAVLRFLGNAVRENAKELWLYSDQTMDWMTENKEFLLKWFSLMLECLKNGTKISIIHNIDRGFEEMTAAIKGWLPLYMTGNIRSYYSTKPNGGRFTNTIFLAPDMACIFNCGISGQTEKARYDYFTDGKNLEHCKEMFGLLMHDCKELLKIVPHDAKQARAISETKGVHIIQNIPSLATMPESLAKKISSDNKQIFKEWELQRDRYSVNLENGFVYEYILLPDDEELFKKTVRIDTTLDELYYTPEDFAEHIKNILALSEKHSNYKLVILPETLVKNCRLIIGENAVIVEHLTAPQTDFIFTHPLMRTAFAVYAEEIGRQHCMQKNGEIQILKQYL